MIEELNCHSVRASLWDYMAESLDSTDRLLVDMHLSECRRCELRRAEVRSMRLGLRGLPPVPASPILKTRLRVLASRERSRHILRRDLAARFEDLKSRARLIFDNLLKPIAVPAAGGLLASFLCFGVLVDTLHAHWQYQNDIPVGLFTQVAINDFSPFEVKGQDVIVELTVNSNGVVTDFDIPQAASLSQDEVNEVGNLVLFTTFTPATAFGQPVTGKILVSIHHINIRG